MTQEDIQCDNCFEAPCMGMMYSDIKNSLHKSKDVLKETKFLPFLPMTLAQISFYCEGWEIFADPPLLDNNAKQQESFMANVWPCGSASSFFLTIIFIDFVNYTDWSGDKYILLLLLIPLFRFSWILRHMLESRRCVVCKMCMT